MKKTLLMVALVLAACASSPDDDTDWEDVPLKAVEFVDLDRYMGRWYMIANIPYFAERGNLAPYVEYSRRDDGTIDDKYTARDSFELPPFTKDGTIEITNLATNAEGRITFLMPLWQDYSVLYLDKDYRYSAIGHPTRDYCWFFSREPTMPDEVYEAMLEAAADNGFDTKRILKIPQMATQQGLPGFQ